MVHTAPVGQRREPGVQRRASHGIAEAPYEIGSEQYDLESQAQGALVELWSVHNANGLVV